jgi:hypothetical protein
MSSTAVLGRCIGAPGRSGRIVVLGFKARVVPLASNRKPKNLRKVTAQGARKEVRKHV